METKLTEKVETALNEARLFMLGVQILLGFHYQSIFLDKFDTLPKSSQYATLLSLLLILISAAMLLLPILEHRLTEHGQAVRLLNQKINFFGCAALIPFACSLALDFYIVGSMRMGEAGGVVAGAAIATLALLMWFGIQSFASKKRGENYYKMIDKKEEKEDKESPETPLKDKIKYALIEVRTVLPGAQALLGFQLAGFLHQSFDKLPQTSKTMHFVALILIALAVLFLLAPASYHRTVERGESTPEMHSFTSKCLLAAIPLVVAGFSLDLYVVAQKITDSTTSAASIAGGFALVFVAGCALVVAAGAAKQHKGKASPQHAH
jgi:hypothetical protein